ncbi:hypothetical protein ACFQU1_20205 [Chelatococcus sp. GCM10030263]|uniref:hypothetical protein n=1 Tax=Chelatococcus sp. GCM10030263 TaxID=3273387 RepID=UPI0036112454
MSLLGLAAAAIAAGASVPAFAQSGTSAYQPDAAEQRLRDDTALSASKARQAQTKRDAEWDRRARAATSGICTGCDTPMRATVTPRKPNRAR